MPGPLFCTVEAKQRWWGRRLKRSQRAPHRGLKHQRRLDSVLRDSDWPCLCHAPIHEPITIARVVEHQFGVIWSAHEGKPHLNAWAGFSTRKRGSIIEAQASCVDSQGPQPRVQVDFAATYPAHQNSLLELGSRVSCFMAHGDAVFNSVYSVPPLVSSSFKPHSWYNLFLLGSFGSFCSMNHMRLEITPAPFPLQKNLKKQGYGFCCS